MRAGDRLPGIPRHSFRLGADDRVGEDFALLDLRAEYRLAPGIALFARLDVEASTGTRFDLTFHLVTESELYFWLSERSFVVGSSHGLSAQLTGPSGTLINCFRLDVFSPVECFGGGFGEVVEAGEYRLLIEAYANNYFGEIYGGVHGFGFGMELSVIPVPEPGAGLLAALGVLLLGLRARSR